MGIEKSSVTLEARKLNTTKAQVMRLNLVEMSAEFGTWASVDAP